MECDVPHYMKVSVIPKLINQPIGLLGNFPKPIQSKAKYINYIIITNNIKDYL